MTVVFLGKFSRDLDDILDSDLKRAVQEAILAMEAAPTLQAFPNIRKMSGFKTAYRVRIRDYRLGLYFENGIIELARFKHRKDIYKVFP